MVVLMLLATLYGVVQLAVLGSPARTVRAATLLSAVLTGVYACGLAVAGLELAYTRLVAATTGTSLGSVVETASYTVDPVIEEIVKLLPLVLVLIVCRRYRDQWGLTDYLLLGAAIGAGFSLLEAVLRFGALAGRAIRDQGGFTVIRGLGAAHISGIGELFGRWLPAPVESAGFLLATDSVINFHLVWTALAALGIGIAIRLRGWWRLLGLAPLAYASLDHAANNFYVARPGTDGLAGWTLKAMEVVRGGLPVVVLLALVATVIVDRITLHHARLAHPDLSLAAERAGRAPWAAAGRFAAVKVPWTSLVAMRFVLARRAAWYALARSPESTPPLVGEVAGIARQIETAGDRGRWDRAWQTLGVTVVSPRKLLLDWRMIVWLVLCLPVLLYFVFGAVPETAAVQRLLSRGGLVPVLAAIAAAAAAFGCWSLVRLVRAIRTRRAGTWGEPLVGTWLRLVYAIGALVAIGLTGGALLVGLSGGGRLVENYHLLDALGDALVVAALLLAIAAFFWFPPFALIGVAGGGAILVVTEAAAATAATVGAAGVLGALGILLSEASESGGSGSSSSGSGSSSGRGQDLDPQTKAKVEERLPDEWGSGRANRKGEGTRWQDRDNPGNGVRVDKGDPDSPNPSQRNDHVVVRRDGRIIGPDGKSIEGSLRDNPDAHIPLEDWLRWGNWWGP